MPIASKAVTAEETRSHTSAIGSRVAEARRRGLDPEERRRVLGAVAMQPGDGWLTHFAVMLGLSMLVAVMGLSADSAAVVIGAMLLAPLMAPVLGIAAAISMGLPRHLLRSSTIVVVASCLSMLGAFVIALALPDGQLPDEVLSRTSPDLRDLMVALAAGAAGAYATVRADVSSALPGVAVAVALVPPLATVGVTMEAGRGDLTKGAVLLYAANLSAIVSIGVVVFILTGFVPPRQLRRASRRVIGGGLLATVATAAVAVPLALASISAAETGQDRQRLQYAADGWVQGTGDELDEVRIDRDVVRIKVSGPNPPPATGDLERTAQQVLGAGAVVEVRWTQTQAPAPDPPATSEPAVSDGELLEAAVIEIIETWVANAGATFDIDRLDVGEDQVRIDLTSARPPPAVDELAARLSEELGLATPVVVKLDPADDAANRRRRDRLRPDRLARARPRPDRGRRPGLGPAPGRTGGQRRQLRRRAGHHRAARARPARHRAARDRGCRHRHRRSGAAGLVHRAPARSPRRTLDLTLTFSVASPVTVTGTAKGS